MKRFGLFLLVTMAAAIFTSCNDSDGDYPRLSAFASVKPLENNDFYVVLDDGKTVYPGDKSRIGSYKAEEDQRVVIYFNLLNNKVEGYDYNMALYYIQDIYSGGTKVVTTQEELDALEDDKTSFKEAFLNSNYLNVWVGFNACDLTKHYVYANYFLARKVTQNERFEILKAVSDHFTTKLYTHNPTPELPDVINKGPIDFYDNMPYVFKCSKINLNITLRSIKSGIPLRCMDIMGAGGFLLTNYQADFLEYFTPDKDFVYYESIDDLIRKCDYYIKHEDERKAIALNGYNKVKEFHNYKVRLNDIFKIAGLI